MTMKMTRIGVATVMLGLLMAGCAPQQFKPGTVYDRIGDELKQAGAERPAVRDAAAEKALMPPLAAEMPKAVDVEPRFDLAVVNAPAPQVFMAIVSGTRYNMLVPPDVTGSITLNLKDVTVVEALDAIRELYGYEYRIKGNRITVQSNSLQTRVFQINYLASRRLGTSELRVTSSAITTSGAPTATGQPLPVPTALPSGQPGLPGQAGVASNLSSRVQTTTESDFWGSLTTALTAIVGNAEGRKVVINPQSGVVVVNEAVEKSVSWPHSAVNQME